MNPSLTLTTDPSRDQTQLLWVAIRDKAATVAGVTQTGASWSFVRAEQGGQHRLELWRCTPTGVGVGRSVNVVLTAAASGALQYLSIDGALTSNALNVSSQGQAGYGRIKNTHTWAAEDTSVPIQALSFVPTSGNVLVLIYANNGTAGDIATITQTGVTWQSRIRQTNGTDEVHVWTGTAGAATSQQITLALNAANNTHKALMVLELEGASTSVPDATAGANQAATVARSAAALTTTQATDLVLSACLHMATGTPAEPASLTSGWTEQAAVALEASDSDPTEGTRLTLAAKLSNAIGNEQCIFAFTTDTGTSIVVNVALKITEDATPSAGLTTTANDCYVAAGVLWTDHSKTLTPDAGYTLAAQQNGGGDATHLTRLGLLERQLSGAGINGVGSTLSVADPWTQISVAVAPAAAAAASVIVPTLLLPPERREFWADLSGQWTVVKDEESISDYTIDWTRLLNGDTIATVTWDVSGVASQSQSNTTTATTIKLSRTSGTAKCTVVTVGGRTHVRRINFLHMDM